MFVVRDNKAEFVPVKTGIAGREVFRGAVGREGRRQVIVGPFASVRELADGAAVKVEAAPRTTTARTGACSRRTLTHESIPRSGGHRAPRDLGEQAAIVPDGAREHRRGDVDHRRGVAHPGHERRTSPTPSCPASAPTTSRSSGCPSCAREEDEERVRNNPRITLTEAAAVRKYSENIGAVAGAGQFAGAA